MNTWETITMVSAVARLLASVVKVGLPRYNPHQVLRTIGSRFIAAFVAVAIIIGKPMVYLIRGSGFVCRASMRVWRYSTLLFLELLDDARLQRTHILIGRELTSVLIYTEITPWDPKFRVLTVLPRRGPLLECHLGQVALDAKSARRLLRGNVVSMAVLSRTTELSDSRQRPHFPSSVQCLSTAPRRPKFFGSRTSAGNGVSTGELYAASRAPSACTLRWGCSPTRN